jgi:nitroreductase
MDILDLLKNRRSVRDFADKNVDNEDLMKLFEAARWAPSSFNGQPWRFIYANKNDNPELYDKLFNLLFEFNQAWAKAAPVIILSMARVKYELTGEDYNHAWHDVGLAVANMSIMATSLGLSVHQMSGFNSEKAKQDLSIPDRLEPVAIMAVGYPAKTGNLPLDIFKMEASQRERKELDEIVFDREFDSED